MSAGAHFKELRFSRFNHISLECSLAVGVPPMILHFIDSRLMSFIWISVQSVAQFEKS